MNLTKSGPAELTIVGNIKTADDCSDIKAQLSALVEAGAGRIVLRLVDSFSMPSSVIGLLIKTINKDGVEISISVGDDRLYELLQELDLVTSFKVRRI